ncbi:protein of unknown function [Candidatus Hydrogenisulfobacillus filiaventi]|uniref:Uncharacterized protein n=1 Tax=Candidatus Hydrogenisulfobacillus filiaventi TaxID=2707344 RepID=A0A6F8ZED1_9FIRM|nr:protein of unknown function [Candidatus Hydrogenisulfobacillus filiaventi]
MLFTDWETTTAGALRELFLLPPTDAAWWVSRRRTDGMPLEVVLHVLWLRGAHPLAGERLPDPMTVAELGGWARLLMGVRGPAAWRGAARLGATVLTLRPGKPAPLAPAGGLTLEQAWRRGLREAAEAAVLETVEQEGLAGVLARAAARRPRGWMPALWWVVWQLGQRWGGDAPALRLAARWQAGPPSAGLAVPPAPVRRGGLESLGLEREAVAAVRRALTGAGQGGTYLDRLQAAAEPALALDTAPLRDAVRLAAADLLLGAGEDWPDRARLLAWTVAVTALAGFVPGARKRRIVWRAAARVAALAAAGGGGGWGGGGAGQRRPRLGCRSAVGGGGGGGQRRCRPSGASPGRTGRAGHGGLGRAHGSGLRRAGAARSADPARGLDSLGAAGAGSLPGGYGVADGASGAAGCRTA